MGVIYFILLIYIMLIFIEIFIVSPKITGLSREKARFQVISLLTSTGFTTKESELITQHPVRRKIAEEIMIFKYVGGIIGTATLFNAYLDSLIRKVEPMDILIWISMLAIILAILKNKWLLNKISFFIEMQLINQSNKNKKKYKSEGLWTREDFGIVDVVVEEGSYLVGMRLKDAGLKNKYIQVLQIDKGDKHYPFPKVDYVFEPGDKLTIYGNLNNIKMLITDELEASTEKACNM